MKVNWKTLENQTPVLFSQRAEWTGFDIRHLRVLPGEMVEQTHPVHRINVTLDRLYSDQKTHSDGQMANEPG